MLITHHDSRIHLRALELAALSKRIIEALPHGYGFLADQLRRAAASIVLNFAEGFAKRSPTERRRYFDIARGSANEVAACLETARAFEVISAEHHSAGAVSLGGTRKASPGWARRGFDGRCAMGDGRCAMGDLRSAMGDVRWATEVSPGPDTVAAAAAVSAAVAATEPGCGLPSRVA